MAVSQWDLRHRALPTCSLKIKGFAGGPRTSCATYFSAASAPAGPNLPNAMSTTHIQSASIATQASVYFDGKCVSHSITMADGTKKSVGVVLAAELTFGTRTRGNGMRRRQLRIFTTRRHRLGQLSSRTTF